MRSYLIKISSTFCLIFGVTLIGIFSFGSAAQAVESQTQPYFIKQLKKDQMLVVSPNFQGELTQSSLLPSLTEISETYHIKATRAIEAEKLNGKLVPGLIVYVENKPLNIESGNVLAKKP